MYKSVCQLICGMKINNLTFSRGILLRFLNFRILYFQMNKLRKQEILLANMILLRLLEFCTYIFSNIPWHWWFWKKIREGSNVVILLLSSFFKSMQSYFNSPSNYVWGTLVIVQIFDFQFFGGFTHFGVWRIQKTQN